MPSLAQYKKNLGSSKTCGEARKYESLMIEDVTWDEDINSETVFFYDYWHDDNKTKLKDMKSDKDSKKIPVRIKYIKGANQTYEKDTVTHRIQFKPSYKCTIPYYKEYFEDIYDAKFPVGLYMDRVNNDGIYERWLVVAEANADDNMYPTYEILKCNHIVQVVINNIMYNFPAVLRSQNSYNSGIWTDYKVTSVEDQQKFCVPVNRDTERLFYNQRIIIDNKVINREPRTWQVTKVNLVDNKGVIVTTLAQTMFDEHKDYIEKDEDGNIVGMWASYYESAIEPTKPEDEKPLTSIYSTISYSGTKPEIKSGGSYKKFTVNFYNKNDELLPYSDFPGDWSFEIKGENGKPCNCDNPEDLITVMIPENEKMVDGCQCLTSKDVEKNQIKIKFLKDDTYLHHILVVKYITNDGIESFVELEIVSL